jgi:hypothetical protein
MWSSGELFRGNVKSSGNCGNVGSGERPSGKGAGAVETIPCKPLLDNPRVVLHILICDGSDDFGRCEEWATVANLDVV